MRVDEPPPGEELNTGEVTEAREAASLILLRDSDEGPEVLLVQRNPEQRFMGGAWVFPGGSTSKDDGDELRTARRELEEEAGIALDDDDRAGALLALDHARRRSRSASTPTSSSPARPTAPRRRSTAPSAWTAAGSAPRTRSTAAPGDELMLVFPTIKHLEQLAEHSSVEDALATARARKVQPVEPQGAGRRRRGAGALPGEPGYDD